MDNPSYIIAKYKLYYLAFGVIVSILLFLNNQFVIFELDLVVTSPGKESSNISDPDLGDSSSNTKG